MTFILVTTMCWMIIFFLILPFGIKIEDNVERGHADSAPKRHYLKAKIILSLLCAMAIAGGYCYLLSQKPDLIYEIFSE